MAMHGFSGHSGSGGGGGSGPVNYLVDDHYYDKEAGIWLPREPLPEVIEGDPALMIQLIDALDHKHKYTSGVLSFSHDDTDKLKASGLDAAITDITGRLKEMLFAGIAPEHQHILIVAHTHLDRLELHYVTPRHNYEVDRAWNPAPPGAGKFRQMDALTDFINVKYSLDDPRDPLRARATKDIKWEPADRQSTREALNAFFKEAVIEGAIDNRQELIELAKEAGFEITRAGKDYVSMKAPGAEKAIRLKGEIYNEQFTSRAELADTKTKSAQRAAYLTEPAVAQRYKHAVREREVFVEKRFKKVLSVVRAGKNHQETQKFNTAKRGHLIEINPDRAGRFTDKRGRSPLLLTAR
ncbi:relaxase/mobilization nuclease domain-containing protein [Pseudomonas aeruginosa]|nr:relaxase/mobilization nuclease domain-containing protein [Pseudomonas aeruginosa]